MKKIIKVQRLRDRTIVIYKDPPKVRASLPTMKQKPVPVWYMGKIQYYIMPDGRKVLPRRPSIIKRIIRHVTTWSIMVAFPVATIPLYA